MIPVILSGGSGTRLWPVSRQKLPKQFCSIFEKSLQDKTFLRCRELGNPWLITSKKLEVLTERSLAQLGAGDRTRVVYEPVGKNTAPAIAVLCKLAQNLNLENEVAGVFPSDHLIGKEKVFKDVVKFAAEVAEKNKVVTLGITPSYPETGYGYIQTKAVKLQERGAFKAYSVVKFHEKPSLDKAKEFVSQQSFSWNAGIFVFKVAHMIELFKKHQPLMWSLVDALDTELSNLQEIYEKVQSISIDYAIMEKLSEEELACVPADFGWSDVGSWDAVSEMVPSQQIIEVKSEGNFVFGDKQKSYSVIGADNLILVDTDDALLVIQKGQSQDVRYVVEALNQEQPRLTQEHTYVYEEWGYREKLKGASQSEATRLLVNPEGVLTDEQRRGSLCLWTIVAGEGMLIMSTGEQRLVSGTQVSLKAGEKFQVINTGKGELEIFEVQSR